MKKLALILLTLLSANSFAGEWTQPLTIKDVWTSAGEGGFSGFAQLRVTFDELPNTRICQPSEALAVHQVSKIDTWFQPWLSTLLSAQAQNKKIKIYVKNCSSSNIVIIDGVKVLRD